MTSRRILNARTARCSSPLHAHWLVAKRTPESEGSMVRVIGASRNTVLNETVSAVRRARGSRTERRRSAARTVKTPRDAWHAITNAGDEGPRHSECAEQNVMQ